MGGVARRTGAGPGGAAWGDAGARTRTLARRGGAPGRVRARGRGAGRRRPCGRPRRTSRSSPPRRCGGCWPRPSPAPSPRRRPRPTEARTCWSGGLPVIRARFGVSSFAKHRWAARRAGVPFRAVASDELGLISTARRTLSPWPRARRSRGPRRFAGTWGCRRDSGVEPRIRDARSRNAQRKGTRRMQGTIKDYDEEQRTGSLLQDDRTEVPSSPSPPRARASARCVSGSGWCSTSTRPISAGGPEPTDHHVLLTRPVRPPSRLDGLAAGVVDPERRRRRATISLNGFPGRTPARWWPAPPPPLRPRCPGPGGAPGPGDGTCRTRRGRPSPPGSPNDRTTSMKLSTTSDTSSAGSFVRFEISSTSSALFTSRPPSCSMRF